MVSIGAIEVCLLAVFLIVPAIIFAKIFEKAGFPSWWGVLMLVPLLNFLMLIYLAVADWPNRPLGNRLAASTSGDETPVHSMIHSQEIDNETEEPVSFLDQIRQYTSPALPEEIICPKCAEWVLLDEIERNLKAFVCPTCNEGVNLHAFTGLRL